MENSNAPGTSFMEQVAQRFGQVYFSYDTISGSFTYTAPAFEQLWGINPEDAASPPDLLSYVHQDDRKFLSHQYRKLTVTREQVQGEFRIVQPDGGIKWICLSACFLNDGEGSLHLIGGMQRMLRSIKSTPIIY